MTRFLSFGVAFAFASFSFASGTNDTVLIIMMVGFVVEITAIIGDLVGWGLSWFAWREAGTTGWFAAAILLPLAQ